MNVTTTVVSRSLCGQFIKNAILGFLLNSSGSKRLKGNITVVYRDILAQSFLFVHEILKCMFSVHFHGLLKP
jgi:hypothetical protein